MTALADVDRTPAERTFAVVTAAQGQDPAGAWSGTAAACTGVMDGPAERLPRVRLVPALPPARPRTAASAPGGVPPTLAERLVLRAGDRSLVLEATDEDRGAPPSADPAVVVRRLAAASVEVIAGVRPAAQLARWLAPGVLDALRSRAALSRHAALRLCRVPAVRDARVCLVEEHVVEATAVVDDGRRVRAVAVRLETHRGAWRATALEIG